MFLLSTHSQSSLTKTLKNLEIWQNYVKVSDTRRDKQRMETLETFEWITGKQLFFSVQVIVWVSFSGRDQKSHWDISRFLSIYFLREQYHL
jgi:hypothetical protein